MIHSNEQRQLLFENECKIAIELGKDNHHLLAQILLWCSVIRGDTTLLRYAFSKGATVNKPVESIIFTVLNHYNYHIQEQKDPDSVMHINHIY